MPEKDSGSSAADSGDGAAEAGGVPGPGAARIRVFLLDDHEVVRRGLRDLLDAEPDLEVVGDASDARQAIARAPALRPHVAVLDVRLGGTDEGGDQEGIEVCRELRARMPELACLMLTSFDDDEALFDAIMAGAAGYVLKQIKGSDLVSAIRTVAAGKSMLDPGATARVMERLRAPRRRATDPPGLARLSPREREVLELVGEGLTNRQIAGRLFLSEKTVKNRISSMLGKLGVGRRVQAAVIAERLREGRDPTPEPPQARREPPQPRREPPQTCREAPDHRCGQDRPHG